MTDRIVADSVADVANRTAELLARTSQGKVDRKRYDLEFIALFDRARGLLNAVMLLLRNGLVQEALILARPAFTDSLALAEYASSNQQRRVELAVGWDLATIASLEGIYKKARAQGDDVSTELGELGERRRQINAFASSERASTRHWQADKRVPELAAKHGRAHEYLDYQLLHEVVHGSTFTTSQRYQVDADGDILIGAGIKKAEVWANATALFVATSALHAARAYYAIASIDEPEELGHLLAEIESVRSALSGA
jgi:hypothetical protein